MSSMRGFFSKNNSTDKSTPAEINEAVIQAPLVNEPAIKILKLKSSEINSDTLKSLYSGDSSPAFVTGFISPHIDFRTASAQIKNSLPGVKNIVLCTTAGELSCDGRPGTSAYHVTGDKWDGIVLQSFTDNPGEDQPHRG